MTQSSRELLINKDMLQVYKLTNALPTIHYNRENLHLLNW